MDALCQLGLTGMVGKISNVRYLEVVDYFGHSCSVAGIGWWHSIAIVICKVQSQLELSLAKFSPRLFLKLVDLLLAETADSFLNIHTSPQISSECTYF